jgi:hypothetical protein
MLNYDESSHTYYVRIYVYMYVCLYANAVRLFIYIYTSKSNYIHGQLFLLVHVGYGVETPTPYNYFFSGVDYRTSTRVYHP